MGLKRYTIFGLIFLIAVIVTAFINASGDFRLVFFGNVYVLPIAVWVAIPAFVLFVVSILHIFLYGVRHYFERRSFESDEKTLKALVKDLMMGKSSTKVFKTKEFSEMGEILSNFNLVPKEKSVTTQDNDVNSLLNALFKINNGQYVNAKELKLFNDNPFYEKNLINQINEDIEFAQDVIKKSAGYSFGVVKEALMKVLAEKNIASVAKFIDQLTLDKEMVLALFMKDAMKVSDSSFSQDKIAELAKKVELSSVDFMNIAKQYKNRMGPDELMRLFENLSSEIDDATQGYLYILFEFEMVDTIREILQNSAKNEYLPYKALLDLKQAGKHYSLDCLCNLK